VARWLAQLCSLAGLLAGLGAVSPEPLPQLSDLASGRYARMHMLLEKTIFQIDVAQIDVAVDTQTRDRFAQAIHDRPVSASLEPDLARIALSAEQAIVQMTFVRHVSLQQWIDGVRESLEQATAAGLATEQLAKTVSDGLPGWFSAAKASGFHIGDRVLYRIQPRELRTLVVRKDGTVVVDRTDRGRDKAELVLGTYFAPGTPYRSPLLRSLH